MTREIDLSGYRDIAEWWARGDRLIAWVVDRGNKGLARVVAVPLDEGEPVLLGQVEIEEIAEPVSWREVSGAEVDPSGTLLAYRKGRAFVLKRLDDLEGQILIGHHDESVRSAVFDPVGERVASVDTTGEVRLWPTSGEASQPSRIIATGHESLREVGFDPAGTRLATRINSAGVGAIWDLVWAAGRRAPLPEKTTGRLVGQFPIPSERALAGVLDSGRQWSLRLSPFPSLRHRFSGTQEQRICPGLFAGREVVGLSDSRRATASMASLP